MAPNFSGWHLLGKFADGDYNGVGSWVLPKHSPSDMVAVFRGVATTGDIETTMLRSVNHEVPRKTKAASMYWLRAFPKRTD